MNPDTRARVVTAVFAVAGCGALLFQGGLPEYLIPHAIFYAVLTLNTYFSMQFYGTFTPRSQFQTLIDGALLVVYVGLAFSIGMPLAFAFSALIIFTLAPAKYAQMLGKTPYDATLRKKILIDLLGTALCIVVLGLTLTYFELKAAWILAGFFAAANVYLLLINPMYRHVQTM